MKDELASLDKHYESLHQALQTALSLDIHTHAMKIQDQHGKTLLKAVENGEKILSAVQADPSATATALAAIESLKTAYESGMQDLEATLRDVASDQTRRIEDTVKSVAEKQTTDLIARIENFRMDDEGLQAWNALLESLSVPDRHERFSFIRERMKSRSDSADWLFHGVNQDMKQDLESILHSTRSEQRVARLEETAASFRKWASRDGGLFFISGKAGSGKSSLLAAICEKFRTPGPGPELLRTWTQGQHPLIVDFFFFAPHPNANLRTFKGLLSSLCHQLLTADIGVATRIRNDPTAPTDLREILLGRRRPRSVYAFDQLKEWWIYLLKGDGLYGKDRKVLVVLDGLDEFQQYSDDSGQEELLELISQVLRECSNVKFLCAARPLEALRAHSVNIRRQLVSTPARNLEAKFKSYHVECQDSMST